MRNDGDEPVGNMRFRVEVEGLPGTGAFEVAFPEARIVRETGKSRRIQAGSVRHLDPQARRDEVGRVVQLVDDARRRHRTATRSVAVVLLDRTGAAVARWIFKERAAVRLPSLEPERPRQRTAARDAGADGRRIRGGIRLSGNGDPRS